MGLWTGGILSRAGGMGGLQGTETGFQKATKISSYSF